MRENRHITKRGLKLPITGEPEQRIEDGPQVSRVAILADDYIGMRHVDFEYEDIYTVQYAILEDDGKGNCTYDIIMSVENHEIADLLDETEAAL